ncbi:MAG: alpha/beta hydrolase [Planctomycetota bacterium]|nr:alpha/beta hydrolase [Planctomycetota bacterium]
MGQSSIQKQEIPLWPEGAPIDRQRKKTEKSSAKITIYPSGGPRDTAIIICPGGGYGGLVTGAEGHGIARWLNRHDVTGVVLEYRLPRGRSFVPLHDAQRAVRLLRSEAGNLKLDRSRIGILGFSAGGHLAGSAAVHSDAGNRLAKDPVEKYSCRPDFAILVYPVVSMELPVTHAGSRRNLLGSNPTAELVEHFSIEKQVSNRTPPLFLAHAQDDRPVPPKNSQLLFAAAGKQKILAEYLKLPTGGHGLNGYKGPSWDRWQRESLAWMKNLPQKKPVP